MSLIKHELIKNLSYRCHKCQSQSAGQPGQIDDLQVESECYNVTGSESIVESCRLDERFCQVEILFQQS